jgi:hypothetical protein
MQPNKLYYLNGEGNATFELTDIDKEYGYFSSAGWKKLSSATLVSDSKIQEEIKKLESRLFFLKKFVKQ